MAAKKASATKTKRKKAGPADPPKAVLDAAFKLAALQGWNATTMSDIARESGLALADLRAMHGSKLGILAAAMRRTDEAVLAGAAPLGPVACGHHPEGDQCQKSCRKEDTSSHLLSHFANGSPKGRRTPEISLKIVGPVLR